jgi:ADP-ribosyl-[dinitrogen reductase] hydrolase
MIDKVKACLLVGALGDAFGSRFELSDIPAGDDAWMFTDDTQLTCATCESILEKRKADPAHLAKAFEQWYKKQGLVGITASTLMAMVNLQGGATWSTCGDKGDHAAGNDAALRTAPLAFILDPLSTSQRKLLRDICRITNHNEEAYHGALAVLLAIRFAQNSSQNFLPNVIRHLPDSPLRDRLIEVVAVPGASIRDIARKFGNRSAAIESVPFALFAAMQADHLGLQATMNAIASSGGDTDTNCALAGQIIGVRLGLEAVPNDWMERLRVTPGYPVYSATIKRFAEFINQRHGVQTLF